MKKIIFFSFVFSFFSLTNLSFAVAYPSTCPVEAQGILGAVGGCNAISCSDYSNICAKCCVKTTAPVKTPVTVVSPTTTAKPAVTTAPKTTSTNDSGNPFTNGKEKDSLNKWIATSTDMSTTSIELVDQTAPVAPAPETKPSVGFVGFVKNAFSGVLRFFGFKN